ncbi:MAG: hypothetical protein NTY39_10145 [Campylobacterales bacterium]|jgi:hypothetical protein|nr:hypothetical protein [Campylobacterales bacterium]
MKKILCVLLLVGFTGVSANDALKAEVGTWLQGIDGGAPKAKYDSIGADKQSALDKFFEECRADVASGKLPKGTCKPLFLEKLKAM